MKQTITALGLSLIQNYCYDSLNRLSSASENSGASWLQTYGFDRFGNRWLTGYIVPGNESRTPTNVNAFNQNNNQIQLSGFGYDAAGNLKNDPTTPANAILYDAENRQVSFTKGGTTTYSYDGDGHRVKKIAGSVTTVFVYNASGQLTAEYTNDTTPPVGGGGTSYLTSDHLGSTRLVTGTNQIQPVKARYDYLPFGEEIPSNIGGRGSVTGYGGTDSTKQKFTQKERDSESGLDYFLARYYSSAQGRFISPDELTGGPDDLFDFVDAASSNPTFYADLTNPQSLNKYQYAYNNPLRYVDPNGHDPGDDGPGLVDVVVAYEKGQVKGFVGAVAGTLGFAWKAATQPSSALDDVKESFNNVKEALKTDIEMVKHPGDAAKALIQVAKEDPKKVAETAGRISGEAAATILMAKGIKAVAEAAASTKVIKLQGAKEVVGQRMVVNTQTGRAFQLHKPHHGKGLHLQEMKVVPHPKKTGAFRITDRNVKSTTIIPMKDRP